MENRRKPASLAATLDINCDCKEYVIDYLTKSFPVRLMAVFKDENGNPIGEMINEVVIAGLTSASNWMIDVVANFNLKVDPYTISSIHMVPKSTSQAR